MADALRTVDFDSTIADLQQGSIAIPVEDAY